MDGIYDLCDVFTGLSLTADRINRLLGSFVPATFTTFFKDKLFCYFTGADMALR